MLSFFDSNNSPFPLSFLLTVVFYSKRRHRLFDWGWSFPMSLGSVRNQNRDNNTETVRPFTSGIIDWLLLRNLFKVGGVNDDGNDDDEVDDDGAEEGQETRKINLKRQRLNWNFTFWFFYVFYKKATLKECSETIKLATNFAYHRKFFLF